MKRTVLPSGEQSCDITVINKSEQNTSMQDGFYNRLNCVVAEQLFAETHAAFMYRRNYIDNSTHSFITKDRTENSERSEISNLCMPRMVLPPGEHN